MQSMHSIFAVDWNRAIVSFIASGKKQTKAALLWLCHKSHIYVWKDVCIKTDSVFNTFNTVTHTLKVHIKVRDLAAGLESMCCIAGKLLSGGIHFIFFLGWHFKVKDQSAHHIILSCTPRVCMLACACGSGENILRGQQTATLKLLAQRVA